ncbi:MAG TPA: hypothetical protein VFK05_39430 [Polyangiaceae bacterium]|nr:hypothetical protein [Polyangiaceae bacterium]
MQGGRSLWWLALFLQLACGSSARDFGRAAAGSNAGGASASAGAAAAAGGKGSSGGSNAGGAAHANGGSSAGASAGASADAGAASGAGGASGAASLSKCSSAADCAALPHVRAGAPTDCIDGKCSIPASSCALGFGHCSASDSEFCETDLGTAANCGACGNSCPSATPLCMDGKCTSTCSGTKSTNCDGTCVDLTTDPENCGACGKSCTSPNATATCANSSCGKPACKPGYGDCTSGPGCETPLNTASDCGACAQKCGQPGDVASCATGTCSIACTSHPEDCFNGKDDDCDGKVDCQDSDCTPQAMCVPSTSYTFGTPIAVQDACPAKFVGGSTTLHENFHPGNGCTGCTCMPTTTECGPYKVDIFYSTDQCATYGQLVASYTLTDFTKACLPMSIGKPWNAMSWTGNPKFNCENTGNAKVSTPTWDSDSKFCSTSSAGGGCSSGNVCVPIPQGSACFLASAGQSCPSQFPTKHTVYDGYSDTRSCTCSCKAYDGRCDTMYVKASYKASDCSDSFAGGQCYPGSQFMELGITFDGAPGAPQTCDATGTLTGSVSATGQRILCCQ